MSVDVLMLIKAGLVIGLVGAFVARELAVVRRARRERDGG